MPAARSFGEQPLQFQEYALLVGTPVTLIGELHRRPDGHLQLYPRQGGVALSHAKNMEFRRTSWERTGCADDGGNHMHSDKVLVSDHRSLLQYVEERDST